MQSPSRHAAPCAHTDSLRCKCRTCRNDSKFLGVHGSGLQPCPQRFFGPSVRSIWRTQLADSHCPKRACLHCSKCACFLKLLGNDDVSSVSSCQHTADDGGKWSARHHCG